MTTTALVKYSDPNLPGFPIQRFTVRRRFMTPIGANLVVADAHDAPMYFAKVKGVKIKDDLFLHADDKLTLPVLRIHPRYAAEKGKTHDIRDMSGEKPKELGSIFRPRSASEPWQILNLEDEPVSEIREAKGVGGTVGRFVKAANIFVPREFLLVEQGTETVSLKQAMQGLDQVVTGEFLTKTLKHDKRLMFAAAVLMCLLEGKRLRF